MKSTKLENPINQLKGINEILKDESFLYQHKDTIRKFFSNHSDVTNYLVITYNIVNGNIDVYDTNSTDEAIYKSKLFDTILIAMFEFEDFCSDPNNNIESKSLISKIQECILKKYKRNLKILLVDNPSVLTYSSKFNDTDVFPFQYLGSLKEQVEYFGVNCTYLIDDNGNLKKEAEHLHFIYKMYKERELNNIINGSSSFDDLIKYYKVFSEDLDSLLETYIGAIFEKDVNDLENGNITFNNPKLFEVVSSLISYIPGGEKESTALKLITGKLFEYIKRFQSERTDVDLIGSRDFKLPYSSTRTRLATSLSNKISKDFCLNVSLFGVNYESLGKGFGDRMLNSSIGILLESGIKIKIRLLSQTQKDDSYSGELKSLVSTTDQWYYIFEWLENLSDDKKELVSFNKSEVEAIEFLLDKKIIETETSNVIEFLKSFNYKRLSLLRVFYNFKNKKAISRKEGAKMSLTPFLVLFVAVFTALYVLGVKSLPKASTVWNKLYRILICILFTNIFVAIIPMGLGWYDGVTLSENKEVQIYRTFKVEFVSDKMVVTSGDDVIYDGKRELLSKPNIHFFENPTFTTNLSLNEDSYSSGENEYTKSLKNSELVVTRVVREKFYIEPGKGFNVKKEKHTESFFAEEVVPRVSFSNK